MHTVDLELAVDAKTSAAVDAAYSGPYGSECDDEPIAQHWV